MAVELRINDGNPWYLSPDIWTVPSDDPNDPPGQPYANVSAYVWALVRNTGTTPVSNATVRYYWANPSVAINDNNSNLIGTSAVSLAAGESKAVLCVTPWLPQWVNDGHECLIAEAFAPSDPLPPRTAATPYDVPGWRQMAQKNLTIGGMGMGMGFYMHSFMAGNFGQGRAIRLVARRAPLELLKPLLANLGLKTLPTEAEGLKEFGLQPYRCGDTVNNRNKPELKLELPPRTEQGVALTVRLPKEVMPGSGALFLIEQYTEDKITGGVGLLLLPEADLRPPRQKRSNTHG
jgi:hypothetical protein